MLRFYSYGCHPWLVFIVLGVIFLLILYVCERYWNEAMLKTNQVQNEIRAGFEEVDCLWQCH